MIRKPIRIVVKSLAVIVALVVIAAGAVVWRLYLGPVDAEFAARHVRTELARSFPDLTIGLGTTEAVWPGDMSGLPLRSKDLRLTGKDGGEVAHFPEVVVTVALLPLLTGQLRLESIRFVRPEIALERDGRGNIALRTGASQSGGQDRLLAMMFGRMAGRPADAEPLGRLRSIEIVDGNVTLSDRPTRRVWRADSLRSAFAAPAGRPRHRRFLYPANRREGGADRRRSGLSQGRRKSNRNPDIPGPGPGGPGGGLGTAGRVGEPSGAAVRQVILHGLGRRAFSQRRTGKSQAVREP